MAVWTNQSVNIHTPILTGIGISIPTQKTEINAGGLQVVYSDTRYVQIPRTGSGAMLKVGGDIVATGNVTAYFSSDERLKENIEPIPSALDKIEQISGVYFDWTDDYLKSKGNTTELIHPKHDVGVIAQQVEQVLPEVVITRADGYKAVNYEKIVTLLIEGIKELKHEIDELKEKNNS